MLVNNALSEQEVEQIARNRSVVEEVLDGDRPGGASGWASTTCAAPWCRTPGRRWRIGHAPGHPAGRPRPARSSAGTATFPTRCARQPSVCIESSSNKVTRWPGISTPSSRCRATPPRSRSGSASGSLRATRHPDRFQGAGEGARRARVPGHHPGLQRARRPRAAAPARRRAGAPGASRRADPAPARPRLPAARRQGLQGEELLEAARQLRPRHPGRSQQRPGLAPPGPGLQPAAQSWLPRAVDGHRARLRSSSR